MSSATVASLTAGLTLFAIEQYNGHCKAVYSDGRKLIISYADAARLSMAHTVTILNKR
jgi:hypothetical protein